MPNIEKYKVSDKINLYLIKDKKYKTVLASTYLHRNLSRKEVTYNSLLTKVLKTSTNKHRSILDMSIYAESLYGLGFDISVSKTANIQSVVAQVSFLNEKFSSKGIFNESLNFMLDMLFDPYVLNGGFLKEFVDNQKRNLSDDIDSLINDKRSYASVRCLEEMCKGEQNAIVEIGYKEDLEKIDEKSLYEHYKSIIFSSPIDIFLVGDVCEDEVLCVLQDYFKKYKFNIKNIDFSVSCKNALKEKYIEDNMDVNQGKLSIGFRTGITLDNPLYYALLTGNSIFGSGAHSKLFNNVREKMSLCYYAYSRLDKYNGIMMVGSGIEFDKFSKTKEAVINELNCVKKGDYTDEELETAKEYIISSFVSTNDSPSLLTHYYIGLSFCKDYPDIEKVCNMVRNVSREEIAEAFSSVCVDTVYFLNGKEGAK